LTPDPVWIAAIVIGTEQDMQLTFAKIVGYIEQSGAAKGYEDLEYLMPYSNQRYIGWGESLNKETKYRYKFIDDKLQQFKIPEKSE